MAYNISYVKEGRVIKEKINSCYESIVRSNQLKKKGYKVEYKPDKERSLVKEVNKVKLTDKELVNEFLTRADRTINIERKS